jgi:3-oxoacyl-[acyl-carrier protein] reductase
VNPDAARDLTGKVALVVGGGRNQGAAISELIAARGATTVFSYVNDDEAAERTLAVMEKHGGTAEAVRSDATDETDVRVLFEGVLGRHGRLDIVVHAAGAGLRKPLDEVTAEDFDDLVSGNFFSAFLTLRAAAKHLADNGRYVVLSASTGAADPGVNAVYAAVKSAVETMVKFTARELGSRGITVNAVAPGPLDNSFYRAAQTPAMFFEAVLRTPQIRLATADDTAPVVGWLIGEDARWVSGQTIAVDGAAHL